MHPIGPSADHPLHQRYEIERELGRGGMATVYLARDPRHARQVAIKVLRPGVATGLGSERFLREIRLAAGLHHPHILPLYDSGAAESVSAGPAAPLSFYVMPYVEGESLRARLEREGCLPVDDAVRIAREVADALDYAHRHDIVHRDIKPENILLEGYPHEGGGSGWHALVADFGIARLMANAGSTLTVEGLAVGTPAYMSPEQVFGDQLDGRSDVYSLGCVLFEMLSGTAPFTGTAQATMTRRCIEPPPRLGALVSGVPPAIEDAVDRALALLAEDRFASAAAFALALDGRAHGGYVHTPAVAAPARSPAIAVLPFTNLSPEQDNEYFSDGMAEELTIALSRVPGLRVASRSSAWIFKGKDADARTVGQRLRVDSLVEGSVRKLGNRIRTYDRILANVFDLQEELSRAIVEELPLASAQIPTLVKPATEDLDAYTLYLRGRYFANKRSLESLGVAVGYFEQAVERDPAYALAHCGLAECWTLRSLVDWNDPALPQALPRAKEAVLRAIAVNPGLHEARGWLAAVHMLYDWDWDGAEVEFRRATESQPDTTRANLWYCVFLSAMGRHEESLRRILRARMKDPVSLPVNQIAARCHIWAGDFDKGFELLLDVREIEPAHPVTCSWAARALLGAGRPRDALEEVNAGMATATRQPLLVALAGRAYCELGRRDEARAALDELRHAANDRYISPFLPALVHASLGELDDTFRLYEQAYAERASELAFLKVSQVTLPDTPAVRKHPRFLTLLSRMRLEP